QARVIRLVKLQGVSIEAASIATGQSPALVKVNIHRGLKKLAALAIGDATALMTAAHSSRHRRRSAACRADDEAVPQNSPQPFSSRLILPAACRTTPSAGAAGRDREELEGDLDLADVAVTLRRSRDDVSAPAAEGETPAGTDLRSVHVSLKTHTLARIGGLRPKVRCSLGSACEIATRGAGGQRWTQLLG